MRAGAVQSLDDPRMPTLAGLRRRGYTPEAIKDFCHRIGIAKMDSTIDVQLLEHCLREDLNKRAPRVMGVLHPLKVVIDNYPDGQTEEMNAINNPEDPAAGSRKVPFSKVLYIEREDFMEVPVEEVLPPLRRARGAPAVRLLRPVHGRDQERRRRGQWNSTAPTTPPRTAATPPMAARSMPRCTGSVPPTPWRPRCGCTTTSSPSPTRTMWNRARTGWRT